MHTEFILTDIRPSIVRSRSNFDKLGNSYEKAAGIAIDKELISNVDCYWFRKPSDGSGNRVIIYLHGGCFALGSIASHGAMVSHIAEKLDTPVLFIDYSLAPEHAFPIAVTEIMKVYKYISAVGIYEEIIIMGDSAGAGLALHLVSMLNKRNMIRPAALVMLSPWVDLRNNSGTVYSNAGIDPVLSKDQLEYFTELYRANNDLSKVNPIENMYGRYPPTFILTGSSEILLDDSKQVFSKIWEHQPSVRLKIYRNATHVFLLDSIVSEPSISAFAEMKRFIASGAKDNC